MLLGTAEEVGIQFVQRLHPTQTRIGLNDILQTLQEPTVNTREGMNTVDRIALVHSLRDSKDTFVGGGRKGRIQVIHMEGFVLCEAMHTLTNHTQTFLDSVLESATDSHHFADRLHRRTEFTIYATELGQVPTRNLADYIVECRFKESRGSLGNAVVEFEESVAHTEFGSHESQRIACRLRRQSGRTTETGIDLDDTIVLTLGVESILHITLAHDTDMANNLDSQRTQFMIFRIGERLRRSDDD